MSRTRILDTKPFIAIALFCLIMALAMLTPSIRFSIINEDRSLITVGTTSLTVGDVVLIFGLLGASVDVAALIVLTRYYYKRK